MQEAVDYRAGLGVLGEAEPDLDWYAEYDGPRIDHAGGSFTIPAVSVSGRSAGLEERQDQLPGFVFERGQIGGREALVGASERGNPRVVIVALRPDYSITLLTYDDVVDLRDLADRLVLASEQQWIAAGGEMVDCVPLEHGCSPDE